MIESSLQNRVLTLCINRPDKANSLTESMLRDLAHAVDAQGGAAEVMVIRATGSVFSAGADLQEVKTGLATSGAWEELSGRVAAFKGLSVAALNGTLAGGAFGMVLACDLRVSVESAKFFYPAIRLGVLPQPSDPVRLAALVGPARAKMLLVAGQKIGARQALSWGLVDQICKSEQLDETVQELISAPLAADPGRALAIKELITR